MTSIIQIKKQVYLFYFEERKSLLSAIYLVLEANLGCEKKEKTNILTQINLSDLAENMIKGLERTQKFMPSLERFEKDVL